MRKRLFIQLFVASIGKYATNFQRGKRSSASQSNRCIVQTYNEVTITNQICKIYLMHSSCSELNVALIEDVLNEKVAKNISKCIKMFSVKSEQQISSGPEAAQVIGANDTNTFNQHLMIVSFFFSCFKGVHQTVVNN